MPHSRRNPFSGKAKKAQLQAKKQQRKNPFRTGFPSCDDKSEGGESSTVKLNCQPVFKPGRGNPNRYVLKFHRESEKEIEERKEEARQTITAASEEDFEIVTEDYFLPELDFPKRPPWDFNMTKEQLDAKENRYFSEYISRLEKQFEWKELSYFELNLETWRQLWRVLEMSDVVLIIVDIRFPALMFPPSLYEYVTKTMKRDMILVLNKVDLAPAPLVVAWKHYFQQKYPSLRILTFTSYPTYNLRGNQETKTGLQERRRRGRLRMAAEGAQMLLEACKDIVKNELDLSSWQQKIKEEMENEYDDEDLEVGETVQRDSERTKSTAECFPCLYAAVHHYRRTGNSDTCYTEHLKYAEGVLTIGCVGQPNVGKSSLMNAIMGKKVVSVSKTPGHTKHFQTIFLTRNVRLCDCPGLVFPSKVPKPLQVLMGSFPIAQLREPYTTVKYLAERLDLPKLLKLQHPDNDVDWSAMDICDGWALKRRFYTAKAARLDSYRAANNLLRMALEGKLCVNLRPPEYSKKKEYWESHPEVEKIYWIQARNKNAQASNKELEIALSSDEEPELDKPSSPEEKEQKSEQSDTESSLSEADEDDDDDDDAGIKMCNKFMALKTGGGDE